MTKSNIETLVAGAAWEKTGNTSWAQCGNCKGWFHVSAGLIGHAGVKLHCPHCHHEFAAHEATRIIKAG